MTHEASGQPFTCGTPSLSPDNVSIQHAFKACGMHTCCSAQLSGVCSRRTARKQSSAVRLQDDR
eukprot:53897-Eustigmatos_ZCMA.PRE.1